MRFTRFERACIVALGIALPLPTLVAEAAESKAVAIRFEGDFDRMGNSFYGPDSALAYEVVRSGQARSVQWTKKWLDANQTPAAPRAVTFDLYAIDSFTGCAALAALSYADIRSDALSLNKGPSLFDVSTFDHELVRGHCIAAKAAREIPASQVVKIDSSQITVTSGGLQGTFNRWQRYEALAQLGIDIVSSGHDLWSRDGMSRALDPVSDTDLVRAIHAGAPMRLAASRLLAERVKQPLISRECKLTHATMLKPTGTSVLRAMLDTDALSQPNSELRLQVMRGLASIRPTASDARLLPQLLSGLEQPGEDFRSPAEIVRQRRVATLTGAVTSTDGEQIYRDNRHFEIASALALLSGPEVANGLANHFEGYLRIGILRSLADQPCADELVANAPYGGDIVTELIRKVDSEKFAIPDIQRRIEAMATIAARKSPQLMSLIQARCGRKEGFLPNGEPAQAAAFCRTLLSGPPQAGERN